MDGKTISYSRVIMTQQMLPYDANPAGNVHGGVIMKLIDNAAAVVASRHARCNVVTASVDRLDFLAPVFVADLVHLKASLNHVGSTSMEIGVRVECENLLTGTVRHTVSAYLTYVALDAQGNPAPVVPVVPETPEDQRRLNAAARRKEIRSAERRIERENAKVRDNADA